MKKYKLGQEITVLHKLVREKQGNQRGWKIKMLPKPLKVIVVGVRVLSNGYMTNTNKYKIREQKRAILVAQNLRSTFLTYV